MNSNTPAFHVRLASGRGACQAGRVTDSAGTANYSGRKSGATWVRWLLWAGAAVLLVYGAVQIDPWVRRHVLAWQWSGGMGLARGISASAEGQWAFLVSLGVLAVARWQRRVDWKRTGLILLLASTLAGVSATAVRSVVGRARPNNPVEQGWFGPYHNGHWLIGRAAYNAFPSGHTATAAGFAFALLVAGSRFGWPFVAWAMAVAWSRIYLSRHNFSDTLASMIIGIFWAWLVREWVDRRAARKKETASQS